MATHCGYLAFMPNCVNKDTTDEIKSSVWKVTDASSALQWQESRTRSITIPQGTLTFLEATCYLKMDSDSSATTFLESLCNRIMSENAATVGNAELLHVLQCPIPLRDFTAEQVSVSFNGDITNENVGTAANALSDSGLVILKSAINESIVSQLRAAFDTQFGFVKQALDAQSLGKLTTPFRFYEIVSRGEGRADMQFPMNDEESAKSGVDIAALQDYATSNAPWGGLLKEVLGEKISLVRIGVVFSTPQCSNEQYWHSDGAHTGQSATFDPESKADSAHHLGIFIPLIDLNEETGYTQFWPGSHKYSGLLSKKGEASLPGDFNGIANAGDAVIYDFRTVHRGMPNKSNAVRPIFYFIYSDGSPNVDTVNFAGPDARLLKFQ